MKTLLAMTAVMALAACDPLARIAPQTVAGFEAGGVLGALDGASGAVVARCITLDGEEIRVAIDVLADGIGVKSLDQIRKERQEACAYAKAVEIASDLASRPE